MFAACAPGLESVVAAEIRELPPGDPGGVSRVKVVPGGVEFTGEFLTLMRANLELRCATRVLRRLASFPVIHLAQLDKRCRKVEWSRYLPAEGVVRIQATCRRSKIYHSGAAAERVGRAIADQVQAKIADRAQPGAILVLARIENDHCTLSLDSSGEPLHRRGLKPEVSAAPLRETLAAGMLRLCGYTGDEPVLDPMCGSGTIVIEAASLALNWPPGAARTFAFMDWPEFEEPVWGQECRRRMAQRRDQPAAALFASDRNGGAVATTRRNLENAGLLPHVEVERCILSDLVSPADSGLLVCNPPYGKRLGRKDPLKDLYAELGQVLRHEFAGWRIGLVTNQPMLAESTGLAFEEPGPQLRHGGIRIRLYQARL